MLLIILAASASLAPARGLAAPGEPPRPPAVSDADVQRHCLAHPHDYDEYELSHIFIRVRGVGDVPGEASRPRPAALALARQLAVRVRRGESFAALAARYSDDGATRADGGRLPSMFRINMLPVFEQAVPALAPGQTSGPLSGPQGIHLVHVEAVHRVDAERARRLVAAQLVEEGLAARAAPDPRRPAALQLGGAADGASPP